MKLSSFTCSFTFFKNVTPGLELGTLPILTGDLTNYATETADMTGSKLNQYLKCKLGEIKKKNEQNERICCANFAQIQKAVNTATQVACGWAGAVVRPGD